MGGHHSTFEKVGQEELAWLGTDPIPASAYYDPDHFERERKSVFLDSWIQVAHICELAGAGSFVRREIEVAKASILIVRGKDGAIRAFYNVCTHRGTQLVDDDAGRRSTFSCPYHRWTFGTDGQLVSAPDFNQFHVSKADCALPPVAIDVCAGLIFIHFGKQPPPLREWLGDLAPRLEALSVAQATTFTEYVYDIEANWKLAYDNFQENYHLRFIHPKSSGGGTGADNPFGYPVHYGFHGPHRTQTIWSNPAPGAPPPTLALAYGKAMAAAASKGMARASGNTEYFALFPNFFMLGSALSPFTHVVYPIGPSRSRGVIRLYWVGEDGSASERIAREYLMASIRDVHAEDRNVIEAGQKGLGSGALRHIHFQTQEILCRHLYLMVEKQIADNEAQMESAVQ
ncbi:MAG: aromatic ring-hydroxylating dioxygenase subunit alpha [Sphingobium sp.]